VKIPEHLWWIAGAFAWLGILAFGVLWWLSGIASIIPGAHDYTTRLPNGYFLTRQEVPVWESRGIVMGAGDDRRDTT